MVAKLEAAEASRAASGAPPPPPPPPVELKVAAVTKNGGVTIEFNQELLLPGFIAGLSGAEPSKLRALSAETGKRKLPAIQELDPLEFLSLAVEKKDGAAPSESRFSVTLEDWTTMGMQL